MVPWPATSGVGAEMGGSNSNQQQLSSAETLQTGLASRQFGLGMEALKPGTSYLTQAYQSGGLQDMSPVYQNKMNQLLDRPASGNFLTGNVGSSLGGRAMAASGVTSEKLTAALDQMNQIRSQLAGQGLRTTGLSTQAGGLEAQGLGLLLQSEPNTLQIARGAAGLGAGLYGAGKQAGWFTGSGYGGPGGSNAAYQATDASGYGTLP